MATSHHIIKIHDSSELFHELSHIQTIIERKETEDNWLQIDDAYMKLIAVVRGSHELSSLPIAIKKMKRSIQDSLLTERTRLSRTVMMLCEELAKFLQDRFDPLSEFIIPALLKLCTRANKVFITCASTTIKTIISTTKLPGLLGYFKESLKSPSKSLRIASMEAVEKCLEFCDSKYIEAHYLMIVEQSISIGITDSSLEVREIARTIFSMYSNIFPFSVNSFVQSLPDSSKKHLRITKSSSTVTGEIQSKRGGNSNRTTQNTNQSSSKPLKDKVDQDHSNTHAPLVGIFNRQKTNLSFFDENGNVMKPEDIVQARLRNTTNLVQPRRLMVEKPNRKPPSDHHLGSVASTNQPLLQQQPSKTKPVKLLSAHGSQSLSSNANHPTVTGVSASVHGVPMKKIQNDSENTVHTSASVDPSPNKHKLRTREPSVSAMSRSEDQVFDLNSILVDAKSNSWSKRVQTFECIGEFLQISSSMQFKQAQAKLIEIYISGLSDTHFKVLNAVIQSIVDYLSRDFSEPFVYPQEAINSLLPRLAAIIYHPQLRSKPGIFDIGMQAYDAFKKVYSSEALCAALVSSLNNPEFARNGKIKVGMLGMMAELDYKDWIKYLSKTSHVKTVLFRLSPLCGDSEVLKDVGLTKAMIRIFKNIYHAAGHHSFFASWNVVKQNDKKNASKLLGAKGDLSSDYRALVKLDGTPKEAFSPGAFRPAPSGRASPFRSRSASVAATAKSPASAPGTPSRIPILRKAELHSSPLNSGVRTPSKFIIKSRSTTGSTPIKAVESVEPSISVDLHSPVRDIQEALDKLAIEQEKNSETFLNPTMNEEHVLLNTEMTTAEEQNLKLDNDYKGMSSEVQEKHGQPKVLVNESVGSSKPDTPVEVLSAEILQINESPFIDPNSVALMNTKTLLSPGKLREALMSEPDEEMYSHYDIVESYSMYEEDKFTEYELNVKDRIETVQMRIKKARPVSFEPNVNGMLNTIIECLMDEEKKTQTVKNALVLLKESLISHSSVIQYHANDVLLAILSADSGKNCTTDDLLEIAYEIDSALNAFEMQIPKPRIIRAVDYVLKAGASPRVCFDMLSRVLEFERNNPDLMREQNQIYFEEEPGAIDFEWENVLFFALKCIDSRKLSARKCAFELIYQYTMVKSNPNSLYHMVGTRYGSMKEMIVRSMMEQRFMMN